MAPSAPDFNVGHELQLVDPADEVAQVGAGRVVQGGNAGDQLGNDHHKQGIDHQQAEQKGGRDGQRTDQPFHLFREEAVEEVFHRVAHRLEQVGDDRAVDERHQDAGQFGDSVAKTLKTVDEKEKDDAQADGPEPCEHPVEVGLDVRFFVHHV